MNTNSIKQSDSKSIIASLSELSNESQLISPDDFAAFQNWKGRLKRVCYMAGEKPYNIYSNFCSQHSLVQPILGVVMPENRDEIRSILNDTPNCIQTMIDAVRLYGIIPISNGRKNAKTARGKNGLKPLRYITH